MSNLVEQSKPVRGLKKIKQNMGGNEPGMNALIRAGRKKKGKQPMPFKTFKGGRIKPENDRDD